ncbi:MAG: hypothetical protein GXP55_06090 [Deltaproteobacteria bacterium]|nr:hypothetical protein [Deltaproteobacteria bacterium]
MPKTTTIAALVAPFLLAGCSGALWGNVVVLALSTGIFVGTLSLGRRGEATRSAEASSSTAPRA